MTKLFAATLSACLWVGWPAAGAELVNLDDFIGGIEKADGRFACQISAPVSDVWGELVRRYAPRPGEQRPTKVKLPQQFASAFGKARAEKHDGFTRIRVPLVGTYRGLRVRQIAFDTGIENGISIVYVLFDASMDEVSNALLSDLVKRTRMSFGEAEIVSRGTGTELVCDKST